MIEEKVILNLFQNKGANLEYDDIYVSLKNLFNQHTNIKKRQIIHKMNRIMVEIEFVKENRQKFLDLTNREKEILILLVKGYNNPKIAEKLFISRYTVEQHRKNMNRKLEVHSIVQLYPFAYAFNLV